MAYLTRLSLPEARDLAGRFGIALAQLEPLEAGSVNSNFRFVAEDGKDYFARIYEEQGRAGAEREVGVLIALEREGLPVVCPIAAEDGSRVLRFQGKPFALFAWAPGACLPLGQVTPAHCKTLGSVLARLHDASPKLPRLPEGRFRPQDMLQRLDQIEALNRADLAPYLQRIRRAYAGYLPKRRPLPGGICHGDLFRDNVLWDAAKISALLDFESAAWGSAVYDLMVVALAWCFIDQFELTRVAALFEGYASVRRLDAAERAALEVEGGLACLRFATTRLTDFELRTTEGQRPARDFRRFLRRLEGLESGVLDPVRDRLAGSTQTTREKS